MTAVGVDGCRGGWIAVVLPESGATEIEPVPTVADALARHGDAVIAVDIPIGLPERGVAAADVAARRFLPRAASRVFYRPPRAALSAVTHAEAVEICHRLDAPGMSIQTWSILPKIREVASLAGCVFEVHPEVSFAQMCGRPLPPKKTPEGREARRAALARDGIGMPSRADADVLDAGAAAWSARRIARAQACRLPERSTERAGVIWY